MVRAMSGPRAAAAEVGLEEGAGAGTSLLCTAGLEAAATIVVTSSAMRAAAVNRVVAVICMALRFIPRRR